MAAGGMGRERDRTRLPLGQRGAAAQDAAPAEVDASAGTPCWTRVVPGSPVPGHVHAWRRGSSGEWEALVVAWLPAPAVYPRSPDLGAAPRP